MSKPACRLCGAKLDRTLIDLGRSPLANTYPTPEQIARGEEGCYSLHARVRDSCLLVQVEEAVPADAIFSDYPYFSSFSSSWVEHARRYAGAIIERFRLTSESLVMEVASNDG